MFQVPYSDSGCIEGWTLGDKEHIQKCKNLARTDREGAKEGKKAGKFPSRSLWLPAEPCSVV